MSPGVASSSGPQREEGKVPCCTIAFGVALAKGLLNWKSFKDRYSKNKDS
jgi:hypothetical protein